MWQIESSTCPNSNLSFTVFCNISVVMTTYILYFKTMCNGNLEEKKLKLKDTMRL